MTEYIPDPYNAHRRQDLQLLTAVNDCETSQLIEALENDGGIAGSEEMLNLVLALTRTHPSAEIVKNVGRGGGSPTIEGIEIGMAQDGLPPAFRENIIKGLRSGEVILRKKKRSGAVGRPMRSPFSPEALAGFRIATLQREKGSTEQEATDAWILESRNGRKLLYRTEVETWNRKARRARAAWAAIEAIAREMDD